MRIDEMWAHFLCQPYLVHLCSFNADPCKKRITTPTIEESAEKKSNYKQHADNYSYWRKVSQLLQPRVDGRTTREGQADRCSEQRQNKKRIQQTPVVTTERFSKSRFIRSTVPTTVCIKTKSYSLVTNYRL